MRGRLSTWTNLSLVRSVVFLICVEMELSDTRVHQVSTAVKLAFPGAASGSRLTCDDMCIPI